MPERETGVRPRDQVADERDRIADDRDSAADSRDRAADERDALSGAREQELLLWSRSLRASSDAGKPSPEPHERWYDPDARHDDAADVHDLHVKQHDRAGWAAMNRSDPEAAALDFRDASIAQDAAGVDRARGRLDRSRRTPEK